MDAVRTPNRLLVCLALAAILGQGGIARAQDTYWTGGTGSWFKPANWTAGVPDATTDAYINNRGTAEIASGNAAAHELILGYTGTDVGYVTMTGGSLTVGSGGSEIEVIGWGAQGGFNQSDGVHTVSDLLSLGMNPTGRGTYDLRGGTLLADREHLGWEGTGTFAHSGGTNTCNYLSIGIDWGAVPDSGTGTYTLTGRDGDVGKLVVNVRIDVGADDGGSGRFEWFDSAATITTPEMRLRSHGTLAMGYIFNMNWLANSWVLNGLDVGTLELTNSDGYAIHTAGAAEIGTVRVGSNKGVGTYWLDAAGSLVVNNDLRVGADGGAGAFLWYGGTLETPQMTLGPVALLTMGYDFDVYDLAQGNLFVGGGNLTGLDQCTLEVGNGAVATHDGGAVAVGHLYVGGAAHYEGAYVLSGPASLSAQQVTVGEGGSVSRGAFVQNGGSVSIAGWLTTAGEPTSPYDWNYDLQEGALTAGAVENAGSFRQGGGTLDAGVLFENSGTFVQEGGTLLAGTFENASSTSAYVYEPAEFRANSVTNTGVFRQSGGLLQASTPYLGTFTNRGYLDMSGGEFNYWLVNEPGAQFNYFGGQFAGVFENWGEFWRDGPFAAAGGFLNYSYLQISPALPITADLSNYGTLAMTGGTLHGPLHNEYGGYAFGYGTFDEDVLNYGTLEVQGGTLNVAWDLTNEGRIVIDEFARLRLLGESAVFNNGAIEVYGHLSGSPFLENEPGGLIVMSGPGAIELGLRNYGLILARDSPALSILNMEVNAGLIRVEEARLAIAGPGENPGTIELEGGMLAGVTIANTGVIRGDGMVANPVNNTGWIEVPPGCGLLFSQGLGDNAGTVAVSGGSFQDAGLQLRNDGGRILGYGTFRWAEMMNFHDGHVRLAGGDAEVIGPVDNEGLIEIVGNTATFYDPVTSSGSIKVTGATVYWLGGLNVIGGSYVSDPADNHFPDLSVGDEGYLAGGAGDRFFVTGDFGTTSARGEDWETTAAELIFRQGFDNEHAMDVTGADLGPVEEGYVGNFAWGTLTIEPAQHLTLADGNAVPGGGLYVDQLALACPGACVFLDGVNLYYRNGGPVKQFFAGDANLSGGVDGADYTLWADHYGLSGACWAAGDFNGDTVVDGADYTLWADNYSSGASSPVPEPMGLPFLVIGFSAALVRRR